MKLLSVLRVMSDEDMVDVADINAPINRCNLFSGKVKDAIRVGKIRNGVVEAIVAQDDVLLISVNIEYQKKRGASFNDLRTSDKTD